MNPTLTIAVSIIQKRFIRPAHQYVTLGTTLTTPVAFSRCTDTSSSSSFVVNNNNNNQLLVLYQKRHGHTVRVLLIDDIPNGGGYTNDVLDVKAGYARNFLIPKKIAVYATKQNFGKYNVIDPSIPLDEEALLAQIQLQLQQQQQQQEEGEDGTIISTTTTPTPVTTAVSVGTSRRPSIEDKKNKDDDVDLKAADLLRYYLRNKTLKIWRHVDMTANSANDMVARGVAINSDVIRDKLSKQLKIDLEGNEVIHYCPDPLQKQQNILSHGLMSDDDRERMIQNQIDFFPPVPQFIIDPTIVRQQKGTVQQQQQEVEVEQSVHDTDDDGTTTATTRPSTNNNITTLKQWRATAKALRPGKFIGDYLARITLRGGYTVPLKIEVLKR